MHIRSRSIASQIALYSLALVVLACQQPEPATAAAEDTNAVPATDEEKTLYTLGVMMGESLKAFSLSESEFQWVQRGAAASALGREPAVDPNDYAAQLQSLHTDRMAASAGTAGVAAQAFLTEQAAVEGVTVSDSGLIKKEMVAGDGASPEATDTVVVHYHGTLPDGTVFDSSVDRGSPARLPLNRVIPCWTEALTQMKVGEKSRLVCPAEIAYGARGQGKIPAHSPIVFEVELIEIAAE